MNSNSLSVSGLISDRVR